MSDEDRLRDAEDALREALRVEPSPRLLRRVRADLASARPTAGAAWLVAAAVVLVLGSALVASLTRPQPDARPAPSASVDREAVDHGRPTDDLARAPVPPPRRPVSTSADPSPEIMVAAGQLEALARFAERARSGQAPPPIAFALVREADAGLSTSAPLTVEPLVITPLASPAPPDLTPWARGGP